MPHAVIIGSVTIDEPVLDGTSLGCRAGGVPTYAGAALHAEGIETFGVTFLEREWEESLRSILSRMGVALRYRCVPHGTRFRNRVSTGGERIQELLAASPPIGSDLLEPTLEDATIVYLGPVHPTEIDIDALELLEAWQGTVAIDVQGLTRSSGIGPVTMTVHPWMDRFLARAQIVKAGEDEVAGLERHYGCTCERLVDRFRIDEFVLTQAERGGRVLLRGGGTVAYSAVTPPEVGDSTGAGDVLLGAYLAARVWRHDTVRDACRLAARRAGDQVAGRFIRAADLRLQGPPHLSD
jgi:sugar/nucleoside kinase (ribokinase family)